MKSNSDDSTYLHTDTRARARENSTIIMMGIIFKTASYTHIHRGLFLNNYC